MNPVFRFAICWRDGRALHAELYERDVAFQGVRYRDNRTWHAETATVENIALAFDLPVERVLEIDPFVVERFPGFKSAGGSR